MSASAAPDAAAFDAVLFLSFGGPDQPADVMPFLENVTRGRGVPRERLEDVAQHYLHFGGVSPINRLNLEMIEALRGELRSRGTELPIWFGNRNWYPMIEDTVVEMYQAGHRRILAFPTSAWGGYSGCKQYHEDIARAVAALTQRVPESVADPILIRKLPQYFSEPAMIDAESDAVRRGLAALPDLPPGADPEKRRVVFTAHSIPDAADVKSGAPADGGRLYSRQVHAAAQAVADDLGLAGFDQVWQSRSGPPHVPWLEPDICDHLEAIAAQGIMQVVVAPIGFISDHLEVIWDLDNEAADLAKDLGIDYVRADTVGTDPRFIGLIADLIGRYAGGAGDLEALGCGDNGSLCREGCCAAPARPVTAGRSPGSPR